MLVKPTVPMLRYRRYRVFLLVVVVAVTGLIYGFAGDKTWQPTAFAAPSLERLGLSGLNGKTEQSQPQALPDMGGERKADAATQPPSAPAGLSDPSKEEGEGELPHRFTQGENAWNRDSAVAAPGGNDIPFSAPERSQLQSGALSSVAEYYVASSALVSLATGSVAPPAFTGPAWAKQEEHFPVTSTISLPTGAAKAIPTIQFQFAKEDATSKNARLEKLKRIKDVTSKNWQSYKKFAWLHDEFKPLSGGYHDPFGGWAATLVDSMDTLYIMGMTKEFEEAVDAVKSLDFTRSLRADIPLFETVIRYLGGLLGAYDISKAKYPVLLDKAKELAEILMGAFDTPNRMPITMYQWQPQFASQPHRAGSNVVLAELGTLSLEFTRLAQLTKEDKYYDAIARITDMFEEWQVRDKNPAGVPGLFPLKVDASGCMKADPFSDPDWSQEILANMGLTTQPEEDTTAETLDMLRKLLNPISLAPDVQRSNAAAKKFEDDAAIFRQLADKEAEQAAENTAEKDAAAISALADDDFASKIQVKSVDAAQASGKAKRQLSGLAIEDESRWADPADPVPTSASASVSAAASLASAAMRWADSPASASASASDAASSAAATEIPQTSSLPSLSYLSDEMEVCAPSNFTSANKQGMDKFSLGGLGDSTYEYFPKEYLLLGGLEEKYKQMHERVVDASTKHLLFRPRVPGNPDILIAGDYDTWISTGDDGKPLPQGRLVPDTHHLSCFVGGMFALGAKIFSRPTDLAVAAKLTSGCVWAYNSTAAGIMPESVSYMACDDAASCTWSDEAYGNIIDPDVAFREDMYHELLADYDAHVAAAKEGTMVPAYEGKKEHMKRKAPPGHAPPVVADTPTAKRLKPEPPMSHDEVVRARLADQHLVAGATHMAQAKYMLRPEAIESVWYMYRITGEAHWRDVGWEMFLAIDAATGGEFGNSAIADVTVTDSTRLDSQESFFIAETLKYFYLLFEEEDVVSLDEWVLNTEAHPFRRPTPGKKL